MLKSTWEFSVNRYYPLKRNQSFFILTFSPPCVISSGRQAEILNVTHIWHRAVFFTFTVALCLPVLSSMIKKHLCFMPDELWISVLCNFCWLAASFEIFPVWLWQCHEYLLGLLQNLTKLRRLNLDENNFTKMPALPPSLVELKINDNKLSGLTLHSFQGKHKTSVSVWALLR